jgi:hypothetical protein
VKLTKSYTTPGGENEAKAEFAITMDGDTVKSVSITTLAGGDISQKLMKMFSA